MPLHNDPLYTDPGLASFYDIENGWTDDCAFCMRLAQDAQSVLDLGCGTGQLASALAADDRAVTGVDPAAAMLDIARQRDGGGKVTFVEGDARTVRLERKFDLIVLTGHAYQVFLSDDDQKAVLGTIAWHLAPGGRFIFDTRDPAAKEWLEWQPENSERQICHPEYGAVRAWNTASFDHASGIVTYETHYVADDDRRWSASSQIRFTDKAKLETMMAGAGLAVHEWYGDWQGAPLTPFSADFIPLGGRA